MPKRRGRPPATKPPARPTDFSKIAPDQLLTVEQVCEYLAISEWFARRLIKQRELTAVYIGSIQRVKFSDLKAFIEQRRGKRRKRVASKSRSCAIVLS